MGQNKLNQQSSLETQGVIIIFFNHEINLIFTERNKTSANLMPENCTRRQ